MHFYLNKVKFKTFEIVKFRSASYFVILQAMLKLFFTLVLVLPSVIFAQKTDKYTGAYAQFFRAEELFQKAQYGAARE